MSLIPLKDEHSRFTDKQWQAIHDSDKNILVSASAGSGKTTVLVNRLIEKIKSGVNVDELLVVTFTNAAAREMKDRIQSDIQKEINVETDAEVRRHLVRQLPLIGQANISTIHSFCLKVIRRYYYLIDVDPVFRLLTDETERALLQEDVLEDVLEDFFEEGNERFLDLVETYANDRNIEPFKGLLLSLYNFAMANPDPKEWLDSLIDLYDIEESTLTNSMLYQGSGMLKDQSIANLNLVHNLFVNAKNLVKDMEGLEKQNEVLENDIEQILSLKEDLMDDEIDSFYSKIKNQKFKRMASPTKEYKELVEEDYQDMKKVRDKAKDALKSFENDYFLSSPAEQVKLIKKVVPLVKELIRVETRFIERYKAKKAEEKVLDFNDLEHLTLDILTTKKGTDEKPSEASDYYRNLFDEVMVDEYQDVNTLQEKILSLVSHNASQNGNQFMVGDVKQSIYGFRLANPDLFIDKYESFPQSKENERIILAENFRSRKDIIEFTNFIFTQLMDKEVGELEYDKNAELINGFDEFPESEQFKTELLIYEKGDSPTRTIDEVEVEENEAIRDKTEGELKIVAHKIRNLIDEGFQIYDKKSGEMRSIQYKDIVLLTPTKNNNIEIQEQLNDLSIPSVVNETKNYFQTTEISIMMSLLKIIDNPRQDIPLAAVLRSMIVGLNENELAAIRLQNKKNSYYDALVSFAEGSAPSALKSKLEDFLQKLNHWREIARRKPLVELIWSLYEDTGLIEYVGGLSGGSQRKSNLHALYERAAAYEKTSFKGLFQFIRFIDKMQQKDKDLAEPSTLTDGDDAVRVMTIHASKGLEFPVVFVLDLSKSFNMQDINGNYVFHEKYGIGTEYFDLASRVRYDTWPNIVIKGLKKNKLLSEQMRVLYVALTRAEQKLFLVGTYKDEKEAILSWSETRTQSKKELPNGSRLQSKGMIDWIGKSLIRHHYFDDYDISSSNNSEIKNYSVDFSVSFFNEEELKYPEIEQIESQNKWLNDLKNNKLEIRSGAEEKRYVSQALERINYTYSHRVAVRTTSFQSVSEIKRLFDEPDDGKMVKIDVDSLSTGIGANRYVQDDFDHPRFMREVSPKPTNSEIGQATHLLLQTIDLSKKVTEENIAAKSRELLEDEAFTSEVAQRIDTEAILNFFYSDFGQEIKENIDVLRREVPFSLLVEAQEIFHDINTKEDHILIHGIIDGFYKTEEGLILFDYKTDNVKRYGQRAREFLLEKYKGQLNLYKRALESIMEEKVVKTLIVSLDLEEIIEV